MSEYYVKWYSGRVLNERPASIIIDGKEILILQVLKEEIQEDIRTRKRERVFSVSTDSGDYEITFSPDSGDVKVRPLE